MSKSRPKTDVRYAVYARTAAGGDAAVEAQIHLAQAASAGRRDGAVVARHTDVNVSGLGAPGPGLAALLDDVSRGRIDVVAVSDVTRLGRSQERIRSVLGALDHAGVRLVTATEE